MRAKEPRDFHIGTRVKLVPYSPEPMAVMGCHDDLLWFGGREAFPKEYFRHLDGVPLGEWVPLSQDIGAFAGLNPKLAADQNTLAVLNKLIRGDIPDWESRFREEVEE